MSRLPAVRILRTLDEVHALAPGWEALHRETESDNPFLTPAWTLGWLETNRGIEPYVVSGFLDGELCAVWPLARTRTPLGRVLGYVEGDAYGLVHRGELPSLARALVAAVAADRASWDALYLNEHFAAAPEHDALLAAFHDAGIHVASLPTSSCPELVFSDRAAFERHVGKKVLREVRKRRRQLEQLGPVRVEELRSVGEVNRGFSRGLEPYKMVWATEVRSAVTVVGHHGSPRGRLLAAALRGRIEAVSALKSREAIVHFKRETLGKLRHALAPATWLDQADQKRRAVRRSFDDRGYGGTAKHIARRLIAPLRARLVTRLYQRQLDERCVPPTLPAGTTIELLTPSGFAELRAAGRHALDEIVRRHYTGHGP